MKNKSLLLVVLLIALAAGGYYWMADGKISLLPAKKIDLEIVNQLPADALGFMAFDLHSEGLKNYMTNPGYKKYVNDYKKLLSGKSLEGMDTYFGFLEKLGLWGKLENYVEPAIGKLVWGAAKDATGIQLTMIGVLAEGKANGVLLSDLSNYLKSKDFSVTESTYSGAKGFQFEIFNVPPSGGSDSPIDPTNALDIYRNAIGSRTLFLAEANGMLFLASAKPLIEELVKDPASKPKPKVLDSEAYAKARARLANDPQDLGFFYMDAASVFSEFMKGVAPGLPVTYVAGTYGGMDTLSGKFVLGLAPMDDKQKEKLDLFEGLPSYSALENFPAGPAMAISVSGPLIKKIMEVVEKENPGGIPPPLADKLKLLTSIDEVAIGIGAPSSEGAWPEGLMMIKSSATKEFVGVAKELASLAFASTGGSPPWKTMDLEGLQTEYIVTPFNVGIYIAESGDKFFFTSAPDAMKKFGKVVAGNSKLVDVLSREPRRLLSKGAGAWVYIDYKVTADIMTSMEKSMGGMVPPDQMAGFKSMQSMRFMGIIGFGFDYVDSAAQIYFFQELNKEGT